MEKRVKLKSREELKNLRDSIIKNRDESIPCITVCLGTGCRAKGAEDVLNEFTRQIKNVDKAKITYRQTGCHGFCEKGPLVVIHPQKIFYQQVKTTDVEEIISETIINSKIVDRLLYIDPKTNEKILQENEIPFYKKQKRVVFANNGLIDPENINDYIALGGYSALSKVLFELKPDEIIDIIEESGLRGRGGGGFWAGSKWKYAKNAKGDRKYIIANGDEGDPGAFMDRSLMEGNPHSVLEGMIIAAYSISNAGEIPVEGYIYVRNEYPLAVKHLFLAIERAREYGLLGEDILGYKFNFDIRINRGGGAFVCGESSALFASIEGRAGEPRAKYVHATDRGLYDKPTNLNNVETYANVPIIINNGVDWYRSIGTENSKGTKIFSLVGKINNTGLVEVPMGITLREMIFGIGGGIQNNKRFKGVQTGGPSGGVIPESSLDLPVDFDELTKVGSMMGSGGMIVMDEDNCMVDIARYFLKFLEDESCGKCVPCREGIKRMKEILDDIVEGNAKMEELDLLENLASVVQDASLCQLGATAPNPVLSTIRYFKDEYITHIKDKKCPAGVCKALITYFITDNKCTGCGACVKVCPSGAILGEKKKPHKIDIDKCIKCGMCFDVCKFDAVIKE